MEEDAAWGIDFNIIDKLLNENIAGKTLHIHQLRSAGEVLILDGLFQFTEHVADAVQPFFCQVLLIGVFHRYRQGVN